MWRVRISASLLFLEKKKQTQGPRLLDSRRKKSFFPLDFFLLLKKLKDPVCWKDVELHIVVVVYRAYVSKRQHTSAYVSKRQHTSSRRLLERRGASHSSSSIYSSEDL